MKEYKNIKNNSEKETLVKLGKILLPLAPIFLAVSIPLFYDKSEHKKNIKEFSYITCEAENNLIIMEVDSKVISSKSEVELPIKENPTSIIFEGTADSKTDVIVNEQIKNEGNLVIFIGLDGTIEIYEDFKLVQKINIKDKKVTSITNLDESLLNSDQYLNSEKQYVKKISE